MRNVILVVSVLLVANVPARAVDRTVIDRAIDRGVAGLKAMQLPDGTWNYSHIGATALAGLTLLECNVPREDRAVQQALKAVRKAGPTVTHTYSVALSILFLDRYDDPSDTPLIESLLVRLLAGQQPSGGYSYECPPLAPEEVRRIQQEMDPTRVLKGGRDLGKLPPKGGRSRSDLPREIQAQLDQIARAGGARGVQPGLVGAVTTMGDTSNTQFATLALWVGRRYGMPTQGALLRIDQHYFRPNQNPDGGWTYSPMMIGGGAGAAALNMLRGGGPVPAGGMGISAPQWTCAGLLALACGHGSVRDLKKAKDGKDPGKRDVSKDPHIQRALINLGNAVGEPLGWDGVGARHPGVLTASTNAYYFLWSLERACVALNLETVGKKDWYNWGAEILLASQSPNGSWHGTYHASGADTCFALLFLKKSNLARDLSGALTGARGGERILRGGDPREGTRGSLTAVGIGGRGRPTSEGSAGITRPRESTPADSRTQPLPRRPEDEAVARLGDDLVRAGSTGRLCLLRKLRDSKGVAYTESLVYAIARMEGEGRREARVALAERFTRLKDTSLRQYLEDVEPEIRRAAALAAAARGSKVLVPDLIPRLDDDVEFVQRAAHTALKALTGQDFGPTPGASAARRRDARAAWLRWWKNNARE